jgi:hypothetical protein
VSNVTDRKMCSDCFNPILPKGSDGRCSCGDPIHTEPSETRPARTTKLARLETVVVQTSEGVGAGQ